MTMDDPENLIIDGLIVGASVLTDVVKDAAASRKRRAKAPPQPGQDGAERPARQADAEPWHCPSCGALNSGRAEFCSLCAKPRLAAPEE
ncbi:MAG: hypothetical protein GX537_01935 [Actinobacteria bacterium]|nr:hypothetical protein [Actinomycetota bacterium]